MTQEKQPQSNPNGQQRNPPLPEKAAIEDSEKLVKLRTQVTDEIEAVAIKQIKTLPIPHAAEQLKTKQYLLEKDKIEKKVAMDLKTELESKLNDTTQNKPGQSNNDDLKLKLAAYNDKIAYYDTSIVRQEKEIAQLEMVQTLNFISRSIDALRYNIRSNSISLDGMKYDKNYKRYLSNNFKGYEYLKDGFDKEKKGYETAIVNSQNELQMYSPRLINLLADKLVDPQKSEILQKWQAQLTSLEKDTTQENSEERNLLNTAINALTNINHASLINATATQSPASPSASDQFRLEIIAGQLLLDERNNEGSLILNPRTPEIISEREKKESTDIWVMSSNKGQLNNRIKAGRAELEKAVKREAIAARNVEEQALRQENIDATPAAVQSSLSASLQSSRSSLEPSSPISSQPSATAPPLTSPVTSVATEPAQPVITRERSIGELPPFTPRPSTPPPTSSTATRNPEIAANLKKIEELATYIATPTVANRYAQYEQPIRIKLAQDTQTAYINRNGLLAKQDSGAILSVKENKALTICKQIIEDYARIEQQQKLMDERSAHIDEISQMLTEKAGPLRNLHKAINDYPEIKSEKEKLEKRLGAGEQLSVQEHGKLIQHRKDLKALNDAGVSPLLDEYYKIRDERNNIKQTLDNNVALFSYKPRNRS